MVQKIYFANIRQISNAELVVLTAELANASCWVEVTNPQSKWFGSIGEIDLNAIRSYYAKNRFSSSTFGRNSIPAPFAKTLSDFYYHAPGDVKLAKGKKLKLKTHAFDLKVLVGYTGPAVYKYASSTTQAIPPQYDLLGSEITPGSFVSASGGQGVYLAKVKELFWTKGYSTNTVRVRLEVIVEPTEGYVSDNPTVGIHNVMVITPDIKQQAMIAKLAKP